VHDVVTRAQRLTTAKVGDARTVLLKQYVYAPGVNGFQFPFKSGVDSLSAKFSC
jgi:hypothetical protein